MAWPFNGIPPCFDMTFQLFSAPLTSIFVSSLHLFPQSLLQSFVHAGMNLSWSILCYIDELRCEGEHESLFSADRAFSVSKYHDGSRTKALAPTSAVW